MKKLTFTFTLLLFALLSFSQTDFSAVSLEFESMTDFTDSFRDKENSKNFQFNIVNATDEQVTILKNKMKTLRGVESLQVDDIENSDNKLVNITFYKFADHWKYYEYFFTRLGVNKIVVENKEYLPQTLGK